MIILAKNTEADLQKAEENGLGSNILCIGGSGTGKTENFIMPNIFGSDDNLIIFDEGGFLSRRCGELSWGRLHKKLIKKYVLGDDCSDPFLYDDAVKDNDINKISDFCPVKPSDKNYVESLYGYVRFLAYPINRNKNAAEAADTIIKNILRYGTGSSRHTDIILDEFANIGKIPDFAESLKQMHDDRCQTSVIISTSSVSQIYALYGKEDGDAIVNLCGIKLFMGGDDRDNIALIGLADESYHRSGVRQDDTICLITEDGRTENEKPAIIFDKKCDIIKIPQIWPQNTMGLQPVNSL